MTKQTGTTAERSRAIRTALEKVVVNAGVGRASTNQQNFEEKVLPQILKDLSFITGQKPQVRRAKKSIAGFKIREGQVVGIRVTLRGRSAVDFFERLTTIVLPRVRDFAGVDVKNVDEHGSLNIGFKEQLTFPEINPEESTFLFSLGVTLVPKTRNRAIAVDFYRTYGIPYMRIEPKARK